MKYLICLLLSVWMLNFSCSGKNMRNASNQREIATAMQRLGEEYYNAGNYTLALQNLLVAYKTIPNDPYLNNSLGLVYLVKKTPGLAENHFKKALKLKPDYLQAKNNLGAAYLKQQKWQLAIQSFKAVLENLLYATPEIALANLGWAYYHQKMFKKAKRYFNQSLEIRPNYLISIHGLASILIETGYFHQAIDFLHHSLEKNPGSAILHSDLAKAYEENKNYAQAKKSWKLVLKLTPEASPLAKEARERLYNRQ